MTEPVADLLEIYKAAGTFWVQKLYGVSFMYNPMQQVKGWPSSARFAEHMISEQFKEISIYRHLRFGKINFKHSIDDDLGPLCLGTSRLLSIDRPAEIVKEIPKPDLVRLRKLVRSVHAKYELGWELNDRQADQIIEECARKVSREQLEHAIRQARML